MSDAHVIFYNRMLQYNKVIATSLQSEADPAPSEVSPQKHGHSEFSVNSDSILFCFSDSHSVTARNILVKTHWIFLQQPEKTFRSTQYTKRTVIKTLKHLHPDCRLVQCQRAAKNLLFNEVCFSKTSSEITQAIERNRMSLQKKHDNECSTPVPSILTAEVLLCYGNCSQSGLLDEIMFLTVLGDKKECERTFFHIRPIKSMHLFHTITTMCVCTKILPNSLNVMPALLASLNQDWQFCRCL